MVREADPDYTRLSRQPWVYEFSNGRLFVDAMLLYSPFDIQDDLLLVGQSNLPLGLAQGGPLILLASP